MQYDIECAPNIALRFRAFLTKLFSCLISIYLIQRNLVEQSLHPADRCFAICFEICFSFHFHSLTQVSAENMFVIPRCISCFCTFTLLLENVVVVYLLVLVLTPSLISCCREHFSLLDLPEKNLTRASFPAFSNFTNATVHFRITLFSSAWDNNFKRLY